MENELILLTEEELRKKVPSAFSEESYDAVSGKYQHYSTYPVIQTLIHDGWSACMAREVNTRIKDRIGYQRHMIRFYHPNLQLSPDEYMSIWLINSHDGKCSYNIVSGIFRVICTNGLVVGWEQYAVRLTHRWYSPEKVYEISRNICEQGTQIAENIHDLRLVTLSEIDRYRLACEALDIAYRLRTPKNRPNVDAHDLLLPCREEKEDIRTLWMTYNIIQENIMSGVVFTDKFGKKRKARKMTSIARDLDFNRRFSQYVWDIGGLG